MLGLILAFLLVAAAPAPAAPPPPANPQIDYSGFRRLAADVEPYRQTRLVGWSQFQRLAADRDTLILDGRSEAAFAQGHIEGAVNLPFSDFTAESLERVIGRSDRRILIYCNNNFSNNRAPVVRKLITVALNIQTFINLVGYGYRNVYELNDVVDFNDPRIGWVSNAPPGMPAAPAPTASITLVPASGGAQN